jgi:hypothetical protein
MGIVKKEKGPWGGARTPGPGKKLGIPRVRLRISDAAGDKLNRIWKARSPQEPGLTEDEIVNALIMQMPEPVNDAEIMTALYGTSVAADEEPPIIL